MLTTTLDLRRLNSTFGMELLTVEVGLGTRLPLVVVWYLDSGTQKGARLDIEKRAFLDHFTSQEKEQHVASSISDLVHDYFGGSRSFSHFGGRAV
jgi:hypothetical protein